MIPECRGLWFLGRLLVVALVLGSLIGFPTSRAAAEKLEVPGPVVERPVYTEFRLIPVERTRYARFAKEFFAGEGKGYLTDPFARPLVGGYRILAGRHRVSGAAEPDLVLMIDPLVRERYAPQEATAVVFRRIGRSWHLETAVSGYASPSDGAVWALVSPVVGVTYRYDGPDDIEPPFWVPPMRDGRRTIVWGTGGKYWKGTEWKLFCWRRCDERG